MKDKEVSPAVFGIVVLVLVILIGFGIYHFSNPAQPPGPPGGYTPGVPPWMDKQHPDTAKMYAPNGQPAPPPGTPAAQALAAHALPPQYQKPPQ